MNIVKQNLKGDVAEIPLHSRINRMRLFLSEERRARDRALYGSKDRAAKVAQVDQALQDLAALEATLCKASAPIALPEGGA